MKALKWILGVVTAIFGLFFITNRKKKSKVSEIDNAIKSNTNSMSDLDNSIKEIANKKDEAITDINIKKQQVGNLKNKKPIQRKKRKTSNAKKNIIDKTKRS